MPRNERFSLPIPRILHDRSLRLFSVRIADLFRNYLYPQVKAAYTGIYAEIFSKDASKGNGLKALSAHLGIEKEEIACIGDGENDSFMFEESGLKIAMGNAEEMLKQRADYVTSSNRHDGAAEAIEKYIL